MVEILALWIEQKLVRLSCNGKIGSKTLGRCDIESVPLDICQAGKGSHSLLDFADAQRVMELTEVWLDKNYNYFSAEGRSQM